MLALPDDPHTHDLEVRLAWVVIEQRHGDVRTGRVAEHRLDDLRTAVTGPVDDESRSSVARPAASLNTQAPDVPDAAHGRERDNTARESGAHGDHSGARGCQKIDYT